MAKKTYYCKCGRSFTRSSTASITGYEFPETDKDCKVCRYKEVVTRYLNEGTVHKNICQAGEHKPNLYTECSSYSLDGTNNLDIYSLDLDFLKGLTKYALSLEGVEGTHFNSMDRSDCRKSFVVVFAKNKKGRDAKKNIVEKYFPGGKGFTGEFAAPVIYDPVPEVSDDKKPSGSETPFRKARCPYLSSLGQKSILCTLHARCLGEKKFDTEGETTKHSNAFCFGHFDECELYKAGYEKEMSSSEKWVLEYRKCVYCCNSSGATGLVKNHHGSHCFCQVHRDERPNYDPNSLCGWFNKRYFPGAVLPVDNVLEVNNVPKAVNEIKLPHSDCKADCANLKDGRCSISTISGRVLSGMLNLYSDLDCNVAVGLKLQYLKEIKGCAYAHAGCAGLTCASALAGEYCCYNCPNPCNSSCGHSKNMVPFGKLNLEDKAASGGAVYVKHPYFDPSLEGRLDFIRSRSEDVLNNYVEIGFTLVEMKDRKLYAEKGYENLVDCVEAELGMKKSTCYNLIKIAEKFGDPDTRRLNPEFSQYNYAQCLEMSTMTNEQLSLVSPDMSKRDMQDFKKERKAVSNRLEKPESVRAPESAGVPGGAHDMVDPYIEISDYKVVDELTQEQSAAVSEESLDKVGLPIENSETEEDALNSAVVGPFGPDEVMTGQVELEEEMPPENMLTLEAFAKAVDGREKDMLGLIDDVKKKYKVKKVEDLPGAKHDCRLCLEAVGFLKCLTEFKALFSEAFDI